MSVNRFALILRHGLALLVRLRMTEKRALAQQYEGNHRLKPMATGPGALAERVCARSEQTSLPLGERSEPSEGVCDERSRIVRTAERERSDSK
jgi:hypothetical protein